MGAGETSVFIEKKNNSSYYGIALLHIKINFPRMILFQCISLLNSSESNAHVMSDLMIYERLQLLSVNFF